MSDKKNLLPSQRGNRKNVQRIGTRHHLYTGNTPNAIDCCQLTEIIEQSRLLMSTALGNGLVSGSIDASLEEIETKLQKASSLANNDVRVGPFSVLDLAPSSPRIDHSKTCNIAEKAIGPDLPEVPSNTPPTPNIQPLIGNLAAHSDDFLQWSDLFGLNDDLYGITSNLSLDLVDCPDFSAHPGLLESEDGTNNESLGTNLATIHEEACAGSGTLLSSTTDQAPINILTEASFLLNIFQKHVVPRLTVIPLGKKSPWSMLNIPAAIVTLGHMTILESTDVNHAQKTNLYSLLACAAFYIAMTPSSGFVDISMIEYWRKLANQSYDEAKGHMRLSLSEETGGPAKAKYKEQLMAMFGMIESAVRNPHNSRATD